MEIPHTNFQHTLSEFCTQAFVTKPEIIVALSKITTECQRVAKLGLFNTQIPKCVRIDEFEQLQTSAMGQTHHVLADSWVTALKNAVKNSLRDSGKGWFNLHERSRDVYMMSKLRRFMVRVGFLMENNIYHLVEDSLHTYTHFILSAAPVSVQVMDTLTGNG